MAMTINSMINNNYSFSQFTQNYGISSGGKKSANQNNAISTMWNNYANNQSSSGVGFNAADIYGVKESARELLSSYESTRKDFNEDFSSKMDDLSKSLKTLKSTDFNVGKDALTTKDVTTTDKDGKTTTSTQTEMSDGLKTALKNVKDFVSSYNDTVSFMKDNASISKRMGRVSEMFADTSYRASNYNSIGISVGKDGSLTVDEDKLANAITNSPDKVSRIMGKDGLAGKTESHISAANAQKDKLFPSVESLFGKELKTAQVYTSSAMTRMNGYAYMGNFLNMYW
ncbi:flagellar filament capping protein FliD [Anaerovibrio sp.]|uniref:flagellar filament capping protein FliD n=2 Tax=Anaerovibrio sp. TaxID=1872532 RepID=UPI00388EB871